MILLFINQVCLPVISGNMLNISPDDDVYDESICKQDINQCVPGYTWSLSNKIKNQRKHAENGNMNKSKQVSTIPSGDRAMLERQSKLIDTAVDKAMAKLNQGVDKRLEALENKFQQKLETSQKALLAEMKQLFEKNRVPPPPPRTVTIAQTTLDVVKIDDAIRLNHVDEYLNLIGKQGRWLLLQQMRDKPEVEMLLPRCADDLIQEACNWTPGLVSVVDNAIKQAQIPLTDADTLFRQLGHSILQVTNMRATRPPEPQVGYKRVADPAVTSPPKKKRMFDNLLLNLHDIDSQLKPTAPPTNLAQHERELLNQRIGDVRDRAAASGHVDVLQRLQHLESLIDAQGPSDEVTGRKAMMNTARYNPAYTPSAPLLPDTTRNNAGAATAALNEVHRWLAGNALMFPSFERIWKATQKNRPFDSQNINDIRDLILWLQRQLREKEGTIPSSRCKTLTKELHTVQEHLNRFRGDSPHLKVACSMFCDTVVEQRSFGAAALSVLVQGVSSAKAAKLQATTTQSSRYNNNRYGQGSYNNNRYGRGSYTNNNSTKGTEVYFQHNGGWSKRPSIYPNQKGLGPAVCYWCGTEGHYKRDCSYNLQGTPVPIDRFCTVWNTNPSACPGTRVCRKVHRCSTCRAPHPATNCAKVAANL